MKRNYPEYDYQPGNGQHTSGDDVELWHFQYFCASLDHDISPL